jgi:hypothetical protein
MDIQLDQVFRKSEKGVTEIKARSGQLTLRERAALILTDATSTVEAMQRKLGSDAAVLLQMLYEQEYIEPLPIKARRLAVAVRAMPLPQMFREPSTFPTTLPSALPPSSSVSFGIAPVALDEDIWAQFAPLRALAMQRLTPHFGPDVVVILKPLMQARTRKDCLVAFEMLESKMQVNLGRKLAAKVLDGLRP